MDATAPDPTAGSRPPVPGEPVLRMDNVTTELHSRRGVVTAVEAMSLTVGEGETVALVGESGCGKSMTALTIMGLVPSPHGKIASGRILYKGRDIVALSEPEMRRIRGKEISMIFQEPMTSLNPVLTIGHQISEVLRFHEGLSGRQARRRALEMLDLVQISDAARRLDTYPHEISGGMRQRIMIAMALACNPAVLVADEPTTALDVTIQAQILGLMEDLQARFRTSILLITHDLGVVAETADRVIVMYAGRKVEEASVEDIFRRPRHPYTLGLLGAIPRLEESGGDTAPRLVEIPGMVPDLLDMPSGCAFFSRCKFASPDCEASRPPLAEKAPGHFAACWHSDRIAP